MQPITRRVPLPMHPWTAGRGIKKSFTDHRSDLAREFGTVNIFDHGNAYRFENVRGTFLMSPWKPLPVTSRRISHQQNRVSENPAIARPGHPTTD